MKHVTMARLWAVCAVLIALPGQVYAGRISFEGREIFAAFALSPKGEQMLLIDHPADRDLFPDNDSFNRSFRILLGGAKTPYRELPAQFFPSTIRGGSHSVRGSDGSRITFPALRDRASPTLYSDLSGYQIQVRLRDLTIEQAQMLVDQAETSAQAQAAVQPVSRKNLISFEGREIYGMVSLEAGGKRIVIVDQAADVEDIQAYKDSFRILVGNRETGFNAVNARLEQKHRSDPLTIVGVDGSKFELVRTTTRNARDRGVTVRAVYTDSSGFRAEGDLQTPKLEDVIEWVNGSKSCGPQVFE